IGPNSVSIRTMVLTKWYPPLPMPRWAFPTQDTELPHVCHARACLWGRCCDIDDRAGRLVGGEEGRGEDHDRLLARVHAEVHHPLRLGEGIAGEHVGRLARRER